MNKQNMKNPRDKIGNEINVGDLLQVKLEEPYIIGKVRNVSPGGFLLIDKQQRTEAQITITFSLTFGGPPAAAFQALLKIVEPTKPDTQPSEA
jgi:hypothetical protein